MYRVKGSTDLFAVAFEYDYWRFAVVELFFYGVQKVFVSCVKWGVTIAISGSL